ncbi:MAG: flap endonuclease [Gammaproteobacteria bacterium]|nr:MAG: flap endonuclease [Gammaproteobacteria bacterium]
MTMSADHVHLIDSSIYVFRAWRAQPADILSRDGRPFNAVKGFADYLLMMLARERPSHALAAFDECFRKGERNRRHAGYKADRPEAPADLQWQFGRCRQTAEAFGITTLGSPRVEADDIIGQMACCARHSARPVTIISGDKDLVQFVREGDTYWDAGRQQPKGYRDLVKRFRVRPEQIADWLAICGDKSDNIAGVPGVGGSIAARLLGRWGDIDTLYANLGAVAEMQFRGATRVSRLLYEHRDTVYFARTLTGLIEDDTLPRDIDTLLRRCPARNDMAEALRDCGFEDSAAENLAKRAVDTLPGEFRGGASEPVHAVEEL